MLNPLVGRYCNRLPAKELTLTNGTTFTPETESPSDPAAMHGGRGATSAWDQKVFNSISIDQATLFSDQEKAYLSERTGDVAIWEYTSPDGEGGHPGCVRSETAFIVQDGSGPEDIGAVTIVYRAKLLEGEATALNLTHVSLTTLMFYVDMKIDLVSCRSTGPLIWNSVMRGGKVPAQSATSKTTLCTSRQVNHGPCAMNDLLTFFDSRLLCDMENFARFAGITVEKGPRSRRRDRVTDRPSRPWKSSWKTL